LQLIEEYRKHNVLWDPRDENYKKKNLKGDAWKIIGEALNTEPDLCKSKSKGTGKGKNQDHLLFYLFIIDNEDIAIDDNTGDTGTDEEPVDTATSNSLQPQVPPPPKKKENQSLNDDNDEIITFFKFAANKMRKYDTHTKNAVQQAICDIIFKADYVYYSQLQYGYYISPSSSTSTNVPSPPFVCQQNTTPTQAENSPRGSDWDIQDLI
ncbi:uncharacterized protein LOC126973761, partial [Leptidea sinapis]|uniref:uncharacterized protein LOC126973761 n=1 Tax=Leptidea sinapis TaxID=189913 RepID=UPI0021C299A5